MVRSGDLCALYLADAGAAIQKVQKQIRFLEMADNPFPVRAISYFIWAALYAVVRGLIFCNVQLNANTQAGLRELKHRRLMAPIDFSLVVRKSK